MAGTQNSASANRASARYGAEFVMQALMPDPETTALLVKDSALQRVEDFKALAQLIQLHPALRSHHYNWRQAVSWLDSKPLHQKVMICSSPLHRR
ncbi:MAG: hypothetical protein EON54_24630, partial [Alcaligenaceae bacterium]